MEVKISAKKDILNVFTIGRIEMFDKSFNPTTESSKTNIKDARPNPS